MSARRFAPLLGMLLTFWPVFGATQEPEALVGLEHLEQVKKQITNIGTAERCAKS